MYLNKFVVWSCRDLAVLTLVCNSVLDSQTIHPSPLLPSLESAASILVSGLSVRLREITCHACVCTQSVSGEYVSYQALKKCFRTVCVCVCSCKCLSDAGLQ